jgi:transposase-like protein
MQRRVIAPEIKTEVLAKAKTGEKVSSLANQYGISIKTIYTWLRLDSMDPVISVLKYNKLKRENEELKKLVGEITLEMSLGKKS